MHDLYFHCWLLCHPAVYQQSTDSQSIVGQLSANCWQTSRVTQWDLLFHTMSIFKITTDSGAGANCVLTILVVRASLIVLTFILSSHLVIVIAVCWNKKKISVMNSMCLPTIINVGGRTGQHIGTSFLTMCIGLYLLQISKQMLTMSCHSSSQSLLNCCHTHPQSLFGYSHSCADEKK